VPRLGIAGAGVALCGAYLAMLAIMHVLTRRLFAVAFEWWRLVQVAIISGGAAVAGDLLLPSHGVAGLLSRAAVFLLIPFALYATGFAHAQEIGALRRLVGRLRGREATP
jgi:hypothetical protein